MKKSTLCIRILVSVAFLWLVFAKVDFRELLDMIKGAVPLFFLLSFLMAGAMISLSCLKWQVLLDLVGKRLPFLLLLRNYFIGYYFSNILPSNVGGDVVRSYYVGKHVSDQPRVAVTVFMERLTGVMFLLVLVVLTPLVRPGLYSKPHIVIPALGALALLSAVFLLAARRRRAKPASNRAAEPAKKRSARLTALVRHIGSFSGRLGEAIDDLRSDGRATAKVILLTIAFYALTWLNVYLAFRTFGVTVDLQRIMAVVPTIMFIAMIPVSLGSIGLAEGAYVVYFGLVGVGAQEALAMAFFIRFKSLVIGMIGFGFYLASGRDRPENRAGSDSGSE